MGLDKYKKTPCGFCFVEYYTRNDAEHCLRYINGTRLDDRVVRTDWDAGFIEGRQYGRGKTGGQVKSSIVNLVFIYRKIYCRLEMNIVQITIVEEVDMEKYYSKRYFFNFTVFHNPLLRGYN